MCIFLDHVTVQPAPNPSSGFRSQWDVIASLSDVQMCMPTGDLERHATCIATRLSVWIDALSIPQEKIDETPWQRPRKAIFTSMVQPWTPDAEM